MSLSEDRALAAQVLSTLDGVQGYEFRPTDFNAGDAWTLFERGSNPAGANHQVTWRIIIVLPEGEQDAMSWFDENLVAVSDVLSEQFGYVDEYEAGNLATEAGTRNVMILTVRREA